MVLPFDAASSRKGHGIVEFSPMVSRGQYHASLHIRCASKLLLSYMMAEGPHHWTGAMPATLSFFLPVCCSFLHVSPLPRAKSPSVNGGAAFSVNAGMTGRLNVSLYSPVWTSAVSCAIDLAIATIGFFLLTPLTPRAVGESNELCIGNDPEV